MYFRNNNQLHFTCSFGLKFNLVLQSTTNGYPIELSELAIWIIQSDIRFRWIMPSYISIRFLKKLSESIFISKKISGYPKNIFELLSNPLRSENIHTMIPLSYIIFRACLAGFYILVKTFLIEILFRSISLIN